MAKVLHQEDLKEVNRFLKSNPQAEQLREYLSWKSFTVGDVLIKIDKQSKQAVEVSIDCKVPKKYKILHIDEVGCPWVKQISVRGGLGKKLYNLMDMQPTRYSYEIDPEKFEADLFNHTYDPRIEYKRMRDVNPDYGKE